MIDAPLDWITLDAAAARLGCSTRTLQRRIRQGEMQAHRDNGRTLVAVPPLPPPPGPTPVVDPVLVERLERQAEVLERQAEDTNRVAAFAACAAEQSSLAFRERLQTVEAALSDARQTASTWRMAFGIAACVTVVASVAAGYLVGEGAATGRRLSDATDRLKATDAERRALQAEQAALQADLARATALRRLSDAEAVRLASEVEALQALVGPTSDTVSPVARIPN